MRPLSFSEKKIITSILTILLIILFVFLAAYFLLDWSISDIIVNKRWLDPQFAVVLVSIFTGFFLAVFEIKFLDRLTESLNRAIYTLRNALKGNQGEKKAFQKLKKILGEQYKIYGNFQINGEHFDNDVIILGPKGIISIEVKNISGTFSFKGEETYRHDWHNWNECVDTVK